MIHLIALAVAQPLAATPTVQIAPGPEVSRREAEAWRAACGNIWREMVPRASHRSLTLRQAKTVDDFQARTHRGRFEAAAFVDGTIWLQPQPLLDRRPGARGVRRHECVHAWLRAIGVPPLEPLFEELIAITWAGQSGQYAPAPRLDVESLPAALSAARTADPKRYRTALRRALSTFGRSIAVLSKSERTQLIAHLRTKPSQWRAAPISSGLVLGSLLTSSARDEPAPR